MFTTEQALHYFFDQVSSKFLKIKRLSNADFVNLKKQRNVLVKDIYKHLVIGNYKLSRLIERKLPKSDGSHRIVFSSNFKDTIVFKALHLYLQKTLDSYLPDSVIAFRKGHSSQVALRTAQKFYQGKYVNHFMLKTDIRSFYNNIDTTRLLQMLKNQIDISAYRILENLFTIYPFIPQGISGMNVLANFYLHDFDLFVMNIYKGIKYYRYGDDILCIVSNNVQEDIFINILQKSLKNYNLELNKKKTQIIHSGEPFEYLRYSFKGKYTSIRMQSIRKLKKKLIKITNSIKPARVDPMFKSLLRGIEELNTRISITSKNSWLKSYRYVNDVQQIKKLDNWLLERLQYALAKSYGSKYKRIYSRSFFKKHGLKSLIHEYYKLRKVKPYNVFSKDIFQDVLIQLYARKKNSRYSLINLNDLHNRFINKKFNWGEVLIFENIYGKKIVTLQAEDVVIANVLSRYLRKFLNLPKENLFKSRDKFIKEVLTSVEQKYTYIIRFDISKFSDSISLESVVNNILNKERIDNRVQYYLHLFFKNLKDHGSQRLGRGNALISTLKEFVLKDISLELKKLGKVINFADDFIIFSRNKLDLKVVNNILSRWQLVYNKNKSYEIDLKNFNVDALDFLGYVYSFKTHQFSIAPFHFKKIKQRIKRICKRRKWKEPINVWLRDRINKINNVIDATKRYSSLMYYYKITDFGQLSELNKYIIRRLCIGALRRHTKDFPASLSYSNLKKLGLKNSIACMHLQKSIAFKKYKTFHYLETLQTER